MKGRGRARGIRLLGLALLWLALAGASSCDWFKDPVEANLPPETTMESCPSGEEFTAGDDVAFAWSGSDVDGSVVRYEWTYGDSAGETTGESITFEDATEGVHTFSVGSVDDDGDEDPTPATCTVTVSEQIGPVPRVVLVELFTTKYCAYCPNAKEALLDMLEEYGADSLCVVGYHYWREGYSPPDPLATDETSDRIEWYAGGVPSMPRATFDGLRYVSGAPSVTEAKENYRIEIDARKEELSPVALELTGEIDGTRGSVTARVEARETLGAGPNVLRVVVFENDVLSLGDIYEFVTRDILDEEVLTVTAPGDTAVVTRDFVLDPGWDADEIDVVAFVQDDSTKEVLQSARLTRE